MASEAIYDSPLMSMTSKKLTHANTLHNPLRISDGSPANFLPGIPKIYVPYEYKDTPKSGKAARSAPAKLNPKKSKTADGSKDGGGGDVQQGKILQYEAEEAREETKKPTNADQVAENNDFAVPGIPGWLPAFPC